LPEGDRILSENQVDLPSDWFVVPQTKQALRVLKPALCYFQAVGRFCLGKSQVAMSDILSGSTNVYYALFDLGIACLDLVPEYTFQLHREFVYPKGANWERIKHARLTPLKHYPAIKMLGKLAGDYPYLSKIRANLERWVELRELFSYGPWIEVISINAPSPDMPFPNFPTKPIFLKGDLETDPNSPRPFLPLHKEIDLLVPTVDELLGEFPTFLLSLVNEKKAYTRIIVKSMVIYSLIQGPFYLAPHVPPRVLEEVKSRMLSFLAALGEDYFREIADAVTRQWNNRDYVKALESGSRLQADLKVEKRASSARVCTFCGSTFSAEVGQCPNCRGLQWKWET